jgi:hypothetical protein
MRALAQSEDGPTGRIQSWSRRCSDQSKRDPAEFVKYFLVQKLFSPVSLATVMETWLSAKPNGHTPRALADLCLDMYQHAAGRHIVMSKTYVDIFGVDDLRIPCSKLDCDTAVVLAVIWKHFSSYFSRLTGNEAGIILSRSRYVVDVPVGSIVEATYLVFIRRLINRHANVHRDTDIGIIMEFDGFVSTLMSGNVTLTACVWRLSYVYRDFIHNYFSKHY